MTELDAELVPLTLELIDEYGKSVGYTKVTPGDYDTANGKAPQAKEPADKKAIVEDVIVKSRESGLIAGSYKKLYIAGAAFEEDPTPSDTLTIDGFAHTIANGGVKRYYSGEKIALYELWASA